LSSAILYVAIVAIWAGVLIPRWLRRDPSPSAPADVRADAQAGGNVPDEADEEPAPSARRPDDEAEAVTEPRPAPGERRDDSGHRRVLSARRRLPCSRG